MMRNGPKSTQKSSSATPSISQYSTIHEMCRTQCTEITFALSPVTKRTVSQVAVPFVFYSKPKLFPFQFAELRAAVAAVLGRNRCRLFCSYSSFNLFFPCGRFDLPVVSQCERSESNSQYTHRLLYESTLQRWLYVLPTPYACA